MALSRKRLVFSALASVGAALARAGQLPPGPRTLPHPIFPPLRPIVGVALASVDIDATVSQGVATIQVSHVFANHSAIPQEGDFIFPIPEGAVVREFALYDGEVKLDAKLLDKTEATAAYEEIVRRRRDPALLTYAGQSALRVRAFPIGPSSERRVTLKLALVLLQESGTRKFSWALAGPHLPGGATPERASIRVSVLDGGGAYSPTHDVALRKDNDGKTVITWSSEKNLGALAEHPEFELYLSAKDTRPVALSLLAYNASLPQVASLGGGVRQSGYFMIVATPNLAPSAISAPPRRVVLVMDRSGSMAGKKIEQARGAMKVALGKLKPIDLFNILTFSDKIEKLAPQLLPASADNIKRAMAFADDMSADGGTNIHQALLDGLAQFDEKRSGNTVLFFTDGLPTVGVSDQKQIVKDAVEASKKKARCFAFGVGYDVDVPFLDTVSSKLRGDADYVRPDEDIEVKTSQFVAKTNVPSLDNLKLALTGVKAGEIYPRPGELPDLFFGGQLVLVGRYNGEGKVGVTLTGEAGGKPQQFTLESSLPAVATDADFLPRLWASRKIGYLMDEIRAMEAGPRQKESIDEVIALSREFGILTPYTALFVPEPGAERFGRGGFRNGAPPSARSVTLQRAGESATNVSQGARAQRNSGQVGNGAFLSNQAGAMKDAFAEQSQRLRRIARRTFYQKDALWQDASYDPKKQTELIKIKPFSDAYFALARRSKPFAQWAALGNVTLSVSATRGLQLTDESGSRETLSEKEASDLLAGLK